MTTYSKIIQDQALLHLMDQTQVKVTEADEQPVIAPLAASPYWQQQGAKVALQLPATSDMAALAAKLAALRQVTRVKEAGQATLLIRLPEVLFEHLYHALMPTGEVAYVPFRNGVYRDLAGQAAALDQVTASSGQPANVAVGATDLASKAIIGLAVTGAEVSALPQLNFWQLMPWLLLVGSAADHLPQWAKAQLPTMAQQVLNAMPLTKQPLPATDDRQLAGFTQLNLGTQSLVKVAVRQGKAFDVLDEHQPLLALHDDTCSVLIAGGALSVNDAAATAASRNQWGTKKLLGANGLPVPRAAIYSNVQAALADYEANFATKSVVVKPVIATAEPAVTVFPVPATKKAFGQAVSQAAKFGRIMVEQYVRGSSYAVLVINGKTIAALEQIPANVVGDGRSSIQQLVEDKNRYGVRGTGLQPAVPLDTKAASVLASQGFNAATILPRGHQAMLRWVSNFSQGGDGLDVTADLEQSYQALAARATGALQIKVGVVHLIITNLYQAYDGSHNGQAAILNVEATPDLTPFLLPQMGHGQPVAEAVLAALFEA